MSRLLRDIARLHLLLQPRQLRGLPEDDDHSRCVGGVGGVDDNEVDVVQDNSQTAPSPQGRPSVTSCAVVHQALPLTGRQERAALCAGTPVSARADSPGSLQDTAVTTTTPLLCSLNITRGRLGLEDLDSSQTWCWTPPATCGMGSAESRGWASPSPALCPPPGLCPP